VSPSLDLLARAESSPAAPAIETGDMAWTFAELADRATRGAAHVLAAGLPGDAPIALLLQSNARFVAWFHAITLAGRAALPLNTRLTAGELAQQLTDARVGWLLGEAGDPRIAELAARVPGLRATTAPEPGTLPAPRGRLPGVDTAPDATLAMLYTSGTSGRSRCACLSRGNFVASAAAAAERLGVAAAGRWLACMPLFHVGGLSILVRGVCFGAPVRLLGRFEAAAVSAALDGGDIAGVSLVPTMLSRLLEHRAGRPAPAGLRVLLLGGAPAAPELVARALKAGYPICPTYGLTEASSQVATAHPPRSGAVHTSPMLPLLGIEVRIVLDGADAPVGVPGEIAVRGPIVMKGYLHDPEATSRALRGGWLYTGDIGCLDADGGLTVLDRRDDLVISGGENVYPAEIEAVLLEHPSVADAGVTGVPDDDLGARVVAWIVAEDGAAQDARALSAYCSERLADFKRPREFRFMSSLPRTAAGKLQRRRLREISAP
jgi:o-succinylbenzoate---CoA ligase